jgi:hypothetical protein
LPKALFANDRVFSTWARSLLWQRHTLLKAKTRQPVAEFDPELFFPRAMAATGFSPDQPKSASPDFFARW